MDSDGNRQIEAEVEEQVFDGLTEEEAAKAKAPERASARKETREPAKAAKK